MRLRSTCLYTVLLTALALPAAAQDAPAWSVGDVDISGLVDGYYDLNFNHPASGINGLYNFNVQANQFSLSMAKLSMSHTGDPIGFQLDLGYGKAFDLINGADTPVRNIEQAYVSWKPAKTPALEFDFGKFVTSAGAELIEAHTNFNYSRAILFAYAIPYYHFGLRMTGTSGHFTGGVQVVNGWNNVEDNNTGKTLGLTGAVTSAKVSWFNTYYTGPENTGTNTGFRNLYDTVVSLTPSDKLSAYVNFDYGQNAEGKGPDKFTSKWYGIAGAARFQLNDTSAIAPRIEWFRDRDGYSTGAIQDLKEFTITYEYKWAKGLLSRLEYRRDWSDADYFERGNGGLIDHQDTLALGVIAYFGK